jgi:hypothetical protein
LETRSTISILFHNYYGEHRKWISFFSKNIPGPFDLYYNVVTESIYNSRSLPGELQQEIMEAMQETGARMHLRFSTNQGKDIGGKLILFDAMVKNGSASDVLLIMHDKKSPHKADPAAWQEKLFSVADRGFCEKALRVLSSDPSVSVVCSKGVVDTVPGITPSTTLGSLAGRYGVPSGKREYVAGTMFWARAGRYIDFFKTHDALAIRASLEPGNVMDEETETITHSWERLLSWIGTSANGSIRQLD